MSKTKIAIAGGSGKMGKLLSDFIKNKNEFEISGIYDPNNTNNEYKYFKTYDEKNDYEIFGTALIKSEFPLKKELENSTNYLKPIIQARFSPTSGKDISSDDALKLIL